MKKLAYWFFGFVGTCMRVFPRKNKALFFMVHDCHFRGNLRYMYETCRNGEPMMERRVLSKRAILQPKSRGILAVFERVVRALNFVICVNYHFATSKYIFLNDNFLPLAYLKLPEDVVLVQLWHGAGAFKRFGLVTEPDECVRELVSRGNARVDYMPVTARNLIPIYAEAMGIPKEHIHADGIPLLDFYFDEHRRSAARARVLRRYPELTGKRIIFYAPTLRTTIEENNAIPYRMDADRLLHENPGSALIVRFHPVVQPQQLPWQDAAIVNVTEYPDVKELLVTADVLITDYSSVAVEYSLLRRPLYFYMYDNPKSGIVQKGMVNYDRGMYLDAKEFPSGYAETMDELCGMCADENAGLANAEFFWKHNFDCPMENGYSKRIWRNIQTKTR